MDTNNVPIFAALDFETANRSPRSAVALAITLVVDGVVVRRLSHMLRPPTRTFHFARLHGIGADEVADAPEFAVVWPECEALLEQARFLAAHNASFDQSVLAASCELAKVASPRKPFVCTVALAREVWALSPTKLPDVCRHLGIPLRHHDPVSDADACAAIITAAWATARGRRWIRTFLRD